MKYLLIAIIILVSGIRSQAQVDTGRLNIRLAMKQKHASLAANYFSPISDARFKDSLTVAVGSGENPDSIILFNWPVRRLVAFHQRLSAENAGGAWELYREFMDAAVGTYGFSGVRLQLQNRVASGQQPQMGIASYLLRIMSGWEAAQAKVLDERRKLGKTLLAVDSDY